MRNVLRRSSVVTAAMATTLVLTSSGALAHICNNASRSDQGNAKAGQNSQRWLTLDVADIVAGEVADALEDDAAGDCAYAYWIENGGLQNVTIFLGRVLAAENPNRHLRHNGRGIDHVDFEAFDELFEATLEACGPEPEPED
jgi:hypothetical protein